MCLDSWVGVAQPVAQVFNLRPSAGLSEGRACTVALRDQDAKSLECADS